MRAEKTIPKYQLLVIETEREKEREREEKGNGIYWLCVKRSPALYENDTDLLGLILSYE